MRTSFQKFPGCLSLKKAVHCLLLLALWQILNVPNMNRSAWCCITIHLRQDTADILCRFFDLFVLKDDG